MIAEKADALHFDPPQFRNYVSPLIDWMLSRVDLAIQKHGLTSMTMKDPLVCYHDSPVRKDWNNPSPDEVAQSLRKAHSFIRQIVPTVNQLYDSRKTLKDEMEDELKKAKEELVAARLKNTILTSIFSSAISSALLGGLLLLVRLFTHKP